GDVRRVDLVLIDRLRSFWNPDRFKEQTTVSFYILRLVADMTAQVHAKGMWRNAPHPRRLRGDDLGKAIEDRRSYNHSIEINSFLLRCACSRRYLGRVCKYVLRIDCTSKKSSNGWCGIPSSPHCRFRSRHANTTSAIMAGHQSEYPSPI